jgi:hypothetical protein
MKRSYFVGISLLLTQAFFFLSLHPVASIKKEAILRLQSVPKWILKFKSKSSTSTASCH